MTTDRNHLTDALGGRLLAAFLLVALSSVAVLTVAALVATDRGLASARQEERRQVADRVAATAADAYIRAEGWTGADLAPAATLADGAGARLVVLTADGGMVWSGQGMGSRMGGMHGAGAATDAGGGAVLESPVTVAGRSVGTVRLVFPGATTGGRTVAWSWVAGAALVALVAAVLVSAYVSRRLTRPLVALAGAARRFAAGERTARARLTAPGELGEVAHAFDTMADEVVRAETVRRRLAADVAHELRTPLAALQAGLEELRDGLRPAAPARLAALHDQTLRLGRVVQDLADLSAAEAAALSLHLVDTDLAGVARAALAAQRPALDAAGLTVTTDLDTPVPVRADPDRLHQAMTNLLANAARYCRAGDRVRLRARVEDGDAVLEIADTGPGIPPDELPHAFERLWRGRDAANVAGTGIGLAVVRELVTAHRGGVAIDAPPGGGLTVTLRFPARAPARASAAGNRKGHSHGTA
ncbi:HAMP domain-containing histidine kinase [Dactylosporangium aurantiacum]|uniref:histidine kinase n=1 Tax=Dactylosporangium aurantiacum TaxID=35754 RepID=A0A9Q9I8E9_9ACTN|nr:HAMP domain-containing sensor histidine kinase [Dactylosporangium aurantiacum]MDG6110429.1 HAMP domain-containing sensor histidine kinase [Dactylosporangium aurantiacum]UWZ51046.1 HAMP domain-containing histidine kinase [Dactylosporangium aurantiacum]